MALLGWETIREGLSLLWSQVYKPDDGVDLGAMADDTKAAWLERGWVVP